MPVWAAIAASCSIPFFFGPVSDRVEWAYTNNESKNERIAKHFFEKPQPSSILLKSTNLITRYPLELLTNEKIRTLITHEEN